RTPTPRRATSCGSAICSCAAALSPRASTSPRARSTTSPASRRTTRAIPTPRVHRNCLPPPRRGGGPGRGLSRRVKHALERRLDREVALLQVEDPAQDGLEARPLAVGHVGGAVEARRVEVLFFIDDRRHLRADEVVD